MKKSLNLILLSFIFVSSLMFVSAQVELGTGAMDTLLPSWLQNISDIFGMGDTYGVFFISIIIVAILIVALYDILTLTSIFDKKVSLIIGIGLGLIFMLTGMINGITIWITQFAASLGMWAVWIEIIISIIIFIGLSIGSGPIARFAARRKANIAKVKASESAGIVNAGAKFLKEIAKDQAK